MSKLSLDHHATPFEIFDFYFDKKSADPATAPPIVITATFEEAFPGEWPPEIEQHLGGNDGVAAYMPPDDHRRIQLRVGATYLTEQQDIVTTFDFLDNQGKPFPEESRQHLLKLQRLRPLFYLPALRNADEEFSKTAQFWSPFLKNFQMDADQKRDIQNQLDSLNTKIVEAHKIFKSVQIYLSQLEKLVALGSEDVININVLPSHMFDILNQTKITILSITGAKLPIDRHGDGTKSLSVLLLFDAFLKSNSFTQGLTGSKPIVALEEPESRLHPHAIRALWKTLRNVDGQSIIATHSADLLSEVEQKSILRIYISHGKVKVGSIPDNFGPRELNKFNYIVRRTRSELLFARCWLFGEGESEAILFDGVAKVLGYDLNEYGVRCVEYRQGGDIGWLLDAANDLGIVWHCMIDMDAQGNSDAAKAISRIPDTYQRISRYITRLKGATTIEPYLARHGFLHVFENIAVPGKKKSILNTKPGHPDYIDQIIKCIPDKPSAAHAVVQEMINIGPTSVPKALRNAVLKAIALARRLYED
jgi:putative ATP-dependent endonuclease of OLD family